MLSPAELRELREDAARLLFAAQALPGFTKARKALGTPRGRLRQWTFPEIRLACHRPEARGLNTHVERNRHFVSRLEDYRDRIEEFGNEYLFGAEWAARAVHDALRLGHPIALPPGRERWVVLEQPVACTIELVYYTGQAYPLSGIEAAIARLRETADRLRCAVNDAPSVLLEGEQEQLLGDARRRARAEQRMDREEALDAYERRYRPSGGDRATAKSFRSALEGLEQTLADVPVSASARKAIPRARTLLNASVNGVWNATTPREPTDLGARYFSDFAPVQQATTEALSQTRGHHPSPSVTTVTPTLVASDVTSQRRRVTANGQHPSRHGFAA